MPFHFWAPDTYEGAPTPVTAFLSVASKAGGFVALINIIYFGFLTGNAHSAANSWWPVLWVLAALSMTLGNLAALRQTNIVRMLAYSSIAQGGFMLVPFAAAGIAGADGHLDEGALRDGRGRHLPADLRRDEPRRVRGRDRGRAPHAERPRSRRTTGCSRPRRRSRSMMTIFLASLAGIPLFAGWFAKFVMFRSIIDAGHRLGDRARRSSRPSTR